MFQWLYFDSIIFSTMDRISCSSLLNGNSWVFFWKSSRLLSLLIKGLYIWCVPLTWRTAKWESILMVLMEWTLWQEITASTNWSLVSFVITQSDIPHGLCKWHIITVSALLFWMYDLAMWKSHHIPERFRLAWFWMARQCDGILGDVRRANHASGFAHHIWLWRGTSTSLTW